MPSPCMLSTGCLTLCFRQSFRKQKEERSRDLRTIQLYRDQSKNEGILSMLTQAITTKHSIHPSFGSAQFFEYVLKNPYNTEHTIVVNCDDSELKWVFSLIIISSYFYCVCLNIVVYVTQFVHSVNQKSVSGIWY